VRFAEVAASLCRDPKHRGRWLGRLSARGRAVLECCSCEGRGEPGEWSGGFATKRWPHCGWSGDPLVGGGVSMTACGRVPVALLNIGPLGSTVCGGKWQRSLNNSWVFSPQKESQTIQYLAPLRYGGVKAREVVTMFGPFSTKKRKTQKRFNV
jgi:hypothetical protein